MILIEFIEPQKMLCDTEIEFDCKFIQFKNPPINKIYALYPSIKNIIFGNASELTPSREEVLKQLGISKEQDELNQIEWAKLL